MDTHRLWPVLGLSGSSSRNPKAVTDSGMPVTAAPRVLAFFREQLRSGRGQEVGHQVLSSGSNREDLIVGDGRDDSSNAAPASGAADSIRRVTTTTVTAGLYWRKSKWNGRATVPIGRADC